MNVKREQRSYGLLMEERMNPNLEKRKAKVKQKANQKVQKNLQVQKKAEPKLIGNQMNIIH